MKFKRSNYSSSCDPEDVGAERELSLVVEWLRNCAHLDPGGHETIMDLADRLEKCDHRDE